MGSVTHRDGSVRPWGVWRRWEDEYTVCGDGEETRVTPTRGVFTKVLLLNKRLVIPVRPFPHPLLSPSLPWFNSHRGVSFVTGPSEVELGCP